MFGDSLSDTGNIAKATLGFLPPDPPYYKGRFSNGEVAVETLAKQLGLGFSLKTNFAIGGATTGFDNINDNDIFKFDGLLDQINDFSKGVSRTGADDDALYLLWAGANDLFNTDDKTESDTIVSTAIANLTTAITTLADLGAENIVVANTPDLGKTPLAKENADLFTDRSLEFNAALADTLVALEDTLDANLILVDLFSISEAIAEDPSDYGFENITDAYLKGLKPADPAADADTFFFWDQVHPTTKSHGLFANVFEDSIITGITDNITRVGNADDNRLVGYSGSDRLKGENGNDQLIGNPGDDLLIGGRGDDRMEGGTGDDLLKGKSGSDVLIGDAGFDRLRGNAKQDFFGVQVGKDADLILDFQDGQDRLALSDSLEFDQLTIVKSGNQTQIQLSETGELLTSLNRVAPTAIDASDFVDLAAVPIG